jgi:hypothetical protein
MSEVEQYRALTMMYNEANTEAFRAFVEGEEEEEDATKR